MNYQQRLLMVLCIWTSYGVSSQRPALLKLEFVGQDEEYRLPPAALDIEALQKKNSNNFEQEMQDRSIRTKKWDRLQRKIFQSSTKEEFEELADELLTFKKNNFNICVVGALCDDGDAQTPSKTYWDGVVSVYNEQAKKFGAKELSLWDTYIDERNSTSLSLSITDTTSILDNNSDLSGLLRSGFVEICTNADQQSPFSTNISSSASPVLPVLGVEFLRLQQDVSIHTIKQQLSAQEVWALGVALHTHRKKVEHRAAISDLICQYHNQVVRRLRTSFASREEFQDFAESLPQPGETDSACQTPRPYQRSAGSPFEERNPSDL